MKILFLFWMSLVTFSGCTTAVESTGKMNDFYSDELAGAEQPPKDSWSTLGTLQTAVTTSRVTSQANFPVSGPYTIQFNLKPPPQHPQSLVDPTLIDTPYRAEAEITWSVEGNSVRRVISVINGASISGIGQAVAVTVRDTTPSTAGDEIPTDGFPYTVGVQYSRGTRPTTGQPVILQGPVNGLDPLSGDTIQIPQDVGAISVMIWIINRDADVVVNDAAKISVTFTNPFGVGFAYPLTGLNAPVFLPIPAASTVMQIFNDETGVHPRPTYAVFWGIDG